MFIGTAQEKLDRAFLKQLDSYTQREVYVKVISLDWNERAIAEITGNVVSGNLTVDGSSTTRRTCSLTLLVDNANSYLNELDWGLKTKFALLVGLKNYVDPTYGDIIWFQQGVFIITSFSQTLNEQGLTVQLQGKDKMCLLDGTVGGALYADKDFGSLDIIDDEGNRVKEYVSMYDLIRSAVHVYALEPYENIIISDLESCAVELLEYNVNNLDLFIYDISTDPKFESYYTSQMTFSNSALAKRFKSAVGLDGTPIVQQEEDYDTGEISDYYRTGIAFALDALYYRLVKHVTYGETAGQRETTLTYAGSLVVNAGEAVTKALSAVVAQLGEFEFFYDIYGRFIFQRKKIYHNVTWSGAITNEQDSTYYDSINSTQLQYEFVNGLLVNTFANRPNLLNIRNDFTLWGTTSTEAPIHLRYAIDRRPTEYKSLFNNIYYFTEESPLFQTAGPRVYIDPWLNSGNSFSDIVFDDEKFITALRNYYPFVENLNQQYYFHYIYLEDQKDHAWQVYLDSDYRAIQSEEFGFIPADKYQGMDIIVTVRNVETAPESVDRTTSMLVDWRELIYQMAYDYSKSESRIQQFTLALNRTDAETFRPYKIGVLPALNNCWYYDVDNKQWTTPSSIEQLELYVSKKRLLFGHIDYDETRQEDFSDTPYLEAIQQWESCWNTGYDAYYSDFLAFWRLIYDSRSKNEIEQDDSGLAQSTIKNRLANYSRWHRNGFWDPDIFLFEQKLNMDGILMPGALTFKRPTSLIFWFDFIGENSELSKYDVNAIGRRPKTINDNDIKAIFFRETPEVLFIDPTEQPSEESNLNYVKLNFVGGLKNYFKVAARKKSAKETLDNLLYEHTYAQESIQLTSLPVYYMEPNTRISVSDTKAGINGEYFVKQFSYSLSHDGMMNLTANRAAERIL